MKTKTCDKAPKGWKCTRGTNHDGPCAAVKVPWYKRIVDALGEAVGDEKELKVYVAVNLVIAIFWIVMAVISFGKMEVCR